MIQGLSDYCDSPNESEGLEALFTGGYRRLALENVAISPTAKHPVGSPRPLAIIFTKVGSVLSES